MELLKEIYQNNKNITISNIVIMKVGLCLWLNFVPVMCTPNVRQNDGMWVRKFSFLWCVCIWQLYSVLPKATATNGQFGWPIPTKDQLYSIQWLIFGWRHTKMLYFSIRLMYNLEKCYFQKWIVMHHFSPFHILLKDWLFSFLSIFSICNLKQFSVEW